jgi:hypothetical protein
MFQLNKAGMCLIKIHICVCLWGSRERKFILSLESVNLHGYGFPTHVMASWTVTSWPLVDVEFDMPGVATRCEPVIRKIHTPFLAKQASRQAKQLLPSARLSLKPRLHDASFLARVKSRGCARRRLMQVMGSWTGWTFKRVATSLHETSARASPALD